MVVVTGGLGFIGNELVRQLLNKGEQVVVVDNRNRVAPRLEEIQHVDVVEMDIIQTSKLKDLLVELKPTSIFHMAAIHFIPECNANPERTLRINVEGTESVLTASAAAGVAQVVFASSGAVYADNASPLSEAFALAPIDIYGWSKLFGEQLCHHDHAMHGRNLIACRLFNNYGPRETNAHIIPEILNQLRSSDQLHLGNISTVRDYIHTSDCASALIRLSKQVIEGLHIVNVATGNGFTVRDIIEKIAEISQRKITINTDQQRFRRFDKQTQVADISLLKQLTNWSPEVGIERGIESLLKFENII